MDMVRHLGGDDGVSRTAPLPEDPAERARLIEETQMLLEAARFDLVTENAVMAPSLVQLKWEVHPHLPALGATDGKRIMVGMGFRSLNADHQMGVLAHEVLHVAMDHVRRGRELRRSERYLTPQMINIAMDVLINDAIDEKALPGRHWRWERFKAMAPEGDPVHQHGDSTAFTFEELALMLASWAEKSGRSGSSGRGEGAQGEKKKGKNKGKGKGKEEEEQQSKGNVQQQMDEGSRMDPMSGDVEDALADDQGEAGDIETRRVAERMAQSIREHQAARKRGQGSVLGNALRKLCKPEVRIVDWRNLLREVALQAFRPRRERTWHRPSTTTIAVNTTARCVRGAKGIGYMPHRRRERKRGKIMVAFDTSGSISNEDCATHIGYAATLARTHSAEVEVVFCDTEVRWAESFDADNVDSGALASKMLAMAEAAPGGGGTCFIPLMDHADEKKAQALFFFTDLQGTHRANEPEARVAWCVHEEHAECYEGHLETPYGRLVLLQKDGVIAEA